MTYDGRDEPREWRMPVIVLTVAILAIAAGVAFGLLVDRPLEVGEAPGSPSPTSAAIGGASPTTSPAATQVAEPSASPVEGGPTPVVQPPDGILPSGSLARVIADGLRVRAEPSTDATSIGSLVAGEVVGVGFSYLHPDWGPVEADGYSWYPIRPLGTSELPPVPSAPMEPGADLGWVAFGDQSGPFLELVAARCGEAGEPTLEVLQSLVPWEWLACYGNRSITVEGVYGCGGCGGSWPGSFEPQWLAWPFTFDLLSVEPQERIGPFHLHFPDDVEAPEPGSILRVTGHFDDPAAAGCSVASGEPPQQVDPRTAELYCRARFVVETYEVTGTDEDFPTS